MTTLRFLSTVAVLLCPILQNEACAQNAAPTAAQATTWRYDNARTGQNTLETKLTPDNVNTATFGKVRSYPVDGAIYAQPLYLSGLSMGGVAHNVVFVATQHDTVYAFDADHNVQLWAASLIDTAHGALAGASTVPSQDVGTSDIVPEIGITATPVIDASTNTIYVEAKSKEGGTYVHRLHALDVTTGMERTGSPVVIAPSIAGTGTGSVNGVVAWQPQWQMERAGMLLLRGKVYMAFASHGDNGPYHGWVLGYDAQTLQPTAVYNTAANGSEAGIWQSGAGLAAETDANGDDRMYVAIGNGNTWDGPPYTDTESYGNAIERLDLGKGIHVADQWTPYDTIELSAADVDQGSGGVILLPDQPGMHPHELVQVGKNGRMELLDRDNLGGFDPGANHVVEELFGQVNGLWSTPAYWNGSVYTWSVQDVMKRFSLRPDGTMTGYVSNAWDLAGFPGSSPVVSSNGTTGGIVWALRTDAYAAGAAELLYAYDAVNLSRLLYVSDQNADRDAAGGAIKFAVPVVVDGKVFVGAQGELDVYGLLADAPATAPEVTFTPAPGSYVAAQAVTLGAVPNATIYYTTDGSTPTTASTVYTGPIPVGASVWLKAFAAVSGMDSSSVALEHYIIGTTADISFSNGFSSVLGMTLNGSAVNADDSRLQLTTGGQNQAGSAFWNTPVDIRTFISDFTFQVSGVLPVADGFTFTLQNDGVRALGQNGGGLGYGSQDQNQPPAMPHSIAIKFDLWSNNGEGNDSTGFYVNGVSPTVPAVDMTRSGLNLSSGDTMRAHIVYDGTTLFLTITDPVALTSFTTNFPIDIPKAIGSNTAIAGFTGATGYYAASQKILTWNFWSKPNLGPPQPVPAPTVTPAAGVFTTPQLVSMTDTLNGAAIHYTLDGTAPSASSPLYTGPVMLATTTLLQTIALAQGYPVSSTVTGKYVFPSATEPAMTASTPEVTSTNTVLTGPVVPVTSDFNGDGKADLGVINAVTSSVSVMNGNGDGSFQAGVDYRVAGGATWLAAGDFNGDGFADLAVVSGSTGKLTVLLNNGLGAFTQSLPLAIGYGAVHVATGDFNRDGNLDLVVTSGSGGSVSILLGDGAGSFSIAATYTAGRAPGGTTVADLNGDGFPDLIVWSTKDNTVTLLLNDGGNGFLPPVAYPVGLAPSSVVAGDFNGDGFPDLAVSSLGIGTVEILLNDGTGKMVAGSSAATGKSPTSLLATDLNGDGILDLAVTNQAGGSLSILLGRGDGTFLPSFIVPLNAQPYLAVAGDFNGDGLTDLAVTSYTPPPGPLLIVSSRTTIKPRALFPVSIVLQQRAAAAQ